MPHARRIVTLLIAAVAAIGSEANAAERSPASELLGLPLVFSDNFEAPNALRWEPTDPSAWKVVEIDGNRVYSQFAQSNRDNKVQNPFRSPFNRALVRDLVVGDVVLDVRLQSTTRDYGHRSLVLFFGYQDPAHLYYVHFGKQADDHANQIFIVNNDARRKISTESTAGTPWTDAWHHARVVRRVEPGTIDVYFDDMDKPVMRAVDKTFTWGQVGVGSFDDTGNFDDIAVYGKKVDRPK